MKKAVCTLFVVLSLNAIAQAPQKMSYQAVIRNASNVLISSAAVGMRISILQGSASGTAVYVETHTPTTNANGLASIEIGTGTVVSGNFSAINWSAGPFFVKSETDPLGGTSYSITGTSQLLSVPYALHSKTADSLSGLTAKHYVGEVYGGGIVFYVYDGGLHGLIAATADQSTGANSTWSNGTSRITGTTGDGLNAGSMNTTLLIATQISDNQTGTFAAKICADYSVTVGSVTYGDWYLPSKYELNLLYLQRAVVGGFAASYYWSSTEGSSNSVACSQHFGNGTQNCTFGKFNPEYVRAIRAF